MAGSISATHMGNGVVRITGAGWGGGELVSVIYAQPGAAPFTTLTAQLGPSFTWDSPAGTVTVGDWVFYGNGALGVSPTVLLTIANPEDPCAAGGLSEAELRALLTQDSSILIDGHSFQGPSVADIVAIDKALMAKKVQCRGGNGWGSIGVARAIPPDSSGVQDE